LRGDEAYRTLDKFFDNSQQWEFLSCQDRFAGIPNK